MKRLLTMLVLAVSVLLGGCNEQTRTNRIYVFSQPGCIHCEHAKSYMDRYYRNYDIKEMNIREGSNMSYMLRYARKYGIKEQALGTPLIIMGDNYIMGWGNEQMKKFNRLARDFKPRKNVSAQ